MKSFTIAYITGRDECHFHWFLDSWETEAKRYGADASKIIIVDALFPRDVKLPWVQHLAPKPTIWQGKHRITQSDWWSNSNNRNTAICLCKTEWICFFDDRCVLMPGYLDALEDAMNGNYVMAGAYEKREEMQVENGVIIKKGFRSALDGRLTHCKEANLTTPVACGGEWLFGANWACPLEWLLQINGIPEICDGQSFEDIQTGLLLTHNGFNIAYDPRAMVIQDRTEGKCGPDYRREDKGRGGPVHLEKSHKLLAMFQKPETKKAIHYPGCEFDIRKVRTDVLAGKPWPTPNRDFPFVDWYDNQPVKEFV